MESVHGGLGGGPGCVGDAHHGGRLSVDDFALQPFDPLDTADVYELIVERHGAASTVVTSNREPIEWLGQMADALLAQSAIDRLQSAAYELVLDGESYRRRQKPGLDVGTTTPRARRRRALDQSSPGRHHQLRPTLTSPTSGPMPLAEGWSHQAGGRHIEPAPATRTVPDANSSCIVDPCGGPVLTPRP